jgi:hydroxymethylbilane synthase
VPPRGPTGDAFVSRRHARFDALPAGAVVATSSQRRRSQAQHRRPDLQLVDIRGNVETRLRKLTEQNLDGLILAQAGLERLGRAEAITEILDPAWMLPAVGQGALGLECRKDDAATRAVVGPLNDLATFQAVQAERALLFALGGGCQLPIAAATQMTGDQLTLRGAVLSPDGQRRIDGAITGPVATAETLGQQLAADLLRRGASSLLSQS